jgi:TolA-binding protein
MFRTFGLVILGFSLLVGSAATQDKKEPPKVKGMLPAGFKDLGLSKAQVEKIYTIQTDFKGKINKLQAEINELKKSENKEVFGVLTEEQREKYLKAKGIETKDKGKEKDKVGDKAKDK